MIREYCRFSRDLVFRSRFDDALSDVEEGCRIGDREGEWILLLHVCPVSRLIENVNTSFQELEILTSRSISKGESFISSLSCRSTSFIRSVTSIRVGSREGNMAQDKKPHIEFLRHHIDKKPL